MQLYKGFDQIVLEQLIPTSIQTSEPLTVHCNSIFHFVYNMAEGNCTEQWITFNDQNLIPADSLTSIKYCILCKRRSRRSSCLQKGVPLQSFVIDT